MAQDLCNRVIELIGENPGRYDTDPERILNLLGKTHSVRFIRGLVPLLAEDTDESRGVARQIAGGTDEYRIGETRYFYEAMPGFDYGTTAALVSSLRDYRPRMLPADLRDADERTNLQNIGLMKVVDAIQKHEESQAPLPILITGKPGFGKSLGGGSGIASGPFGGSGTLRHVLTNLDGKPVKVLNEYALIELIFQRPEDADKMVSAIESHGLTTAREISAVLEGVLPALADGAL
jgi:hypothetical protein